MFSLTARLAGLTSYQVVQNVPKVIRMANVNVTQVREFKKKKKSHKPAGPCDGCRRAVVDIPPPVDPECPIPLERPKRKSILHRIKLKLVEGGTNFGTPFRFLQCKDKKEEEKEEKEVSKALVKPKKEVAVVPVVRDSGVQITLLGAESLVGQYLALMLKQSPQVKKLRLYDAKPCKTCKDICEVCARDTFRVAQDLQIIDTNCSVQAFSASCNEIDLSLQSADIVVILESSYANPCQPFMDRFLQLAPTMKFYANAIARECPRAFVVVCMTPIDCMVPLVAETLKETGFYNRRKLLGSIAVPEMRASTLAARALHLEPRYTRVPCVGGTEGDTLVPLFSKAVSDFDFARHNAETLTNTIRMAPWDVTRCECCCRRSSDLSEAHALAHLVKSIFHALLCQDVPRVSGFVETDPCMCISPARYMALEMKLTRHGIHKIYDFPDHLSELELDLLDTMFHCLQSRVNTAVSWHQQVLCKQLQAVRIQKDWNIPTDQEHVRDCFSLLQ